MATQTITPELNALAVPIDSVTLWPKNPRMGDVGAIAESLKRFGQLRPILVQKSSMRIVAGNHVYRAAAALGWTEIAAVVADMSDRQARGFVAADNRMAELGTFDDVLLAQMLAEIVKTDTLEGTGYDLEDLEALLAKVGTQQTYGSGDPDAQKEPPKEPWVKDGQLFEIGSHRILCGGPTADNLDRLLGDASPRVLIMESSDQKEALSLWAYVKDIPEQFWFKPDELRLWVVGHDFDSFNWLVWDKQSENTARDHAEQFELIASKAKHKHDIFRHTLIGAADGEKHGGPDFTERPTALFMEMYERYSTFEAVVLDPVAVGTTSLLAAEKTARLWRGAKSSPAHVQALLEKWTEYTSDEPRLIE